MIESIDDIPMSITVQQVILQSENGPALMYELAKNREEYERICKLPAIAAALEMGKIEAKIASQSKAEVKTKSNAPKPIEVVKPGASSSKSLSDPNLSQREYEALRKEQMASRSSSW